MNYNDIKYRAEKQYKSHKNACEILIRELMTNALHAILISKPDNPLIKIDMNTDTQILVISDNGGGFNEDIAKTLETLDKPNQEKILNNLPSKGEGRLVLAYFAKSTKYSTIKYKAGQNLKSVFYYPQPDNALPFDLITNNLVTAEPIGTKVEVTIDNKNRIIETFNKDHKSIDDFKDWLAEEFFYFFVALPSLKIDVTLNSSPVRILRAEKHEKIETTFQYDKNQEEQAITLYVIDRLKPNFELITLAHHVPAKSSLKYERKIQKFGKKIYVSSDILDMRVKTGGLELDIDDDLANKINKVIEAKLDEHFKDEFAKQLIENKHEYSKAKYKIKPFVSWLPEQNNIDSFKPISEEEFKNMAFSNFATATTSYLSGGNEDPRIVNSALHLYVIHRQRIIEKFGAMLLRYNEAGEKTSTLEEAVHDLIFTRATNSENANEDYHKHNLWLIDDKFSYYSNASSTRNGEALSDIYLFNDSLDKPSEIVIVELKRPVKPDGKADAHNAGTMIKQVRDYAKKIVLEKKGFGGKDIDIDRCVFYGYILASADDIRIERASDGSCDKIPFLSHSYFTNKNIDDDGKYKIHLELLAFSDLEELAKNRNKIFTTMLNKDSTVEN